MCQIEVLHSHSGNWTQYWFAKTEYNFGFAEWYFAERAHYELFLDYIPELNWGESYPK